MVAQREVDEAIDGYFDIRDIPPADKFAEEKIFIPYGEIRGKINLDHTPWAREPICSVTDPEVQVEASVYGSQLAKTTCAICVALAVVELLRQSLIWMWPKADAGRAFSQERFQPVVEASPALRSQKSDNHDLWKNLSLHFKHGVVSFVGSRSRIDQKSKPVPVAIVDEIEDIAGATAKETDPITSLKERTKTFTDKKIFLFGSCLLETGPAWQQYLLGDQRHFLVPCPHCGTRQALEFRGPVWLINREGVLEHRGQADDFRLVWDPEARIDDRHWDYDKVRASAHYVCAECGGRIRDEHKREILKAGQWVPTARAQIYGQRSRRINSLYPTWPNTSFGAFATEFLGSQGSTARLQNFTNNWEAKPWSTGLDLSDRKTVDKRLRYIQGDHGQGERRGSRTMLIADVQRLHLVWALFGFDDRGEVHLLDIGYTRDFDSLRTLDDERSPDWVVLDTRYRRQQVYEAVHTRRNRWFALQGEASGRPLSPNHKFDPFTGDQQGREGHFQISLIHINSDLWGEEILGRLYPAAKAEQSLEGLARAFAGKAAAPDPAGPVAAAAAAETREDPDAPRIKDFHVFAGFDKHGDFVRQLFSEYIVEYINAKNKQVREWKRSKNNHLFDLVKYAYAIGSMLNLTRVAVDVRAAIEKAAAAAAAAKAASNQEELDLSKPRGGSALFN